MAIARCESCGPPQNLKARYVHHHEPLGYPNSRVLCASATCSRPAYVWLTDEEEVQYLQNRRRLWFRIEAACRSHDPGTREGAYVGAAD